MAHPTPLDILDYYKRSQEAILALRMAVEPSLSAGAVQPSSHFYGMTTGEFNDAIADLGRELELEVVLMLVASFEAIIQVDLRERVERRKKCGASKKLRSLWYETPPKHRQPMAMDRVLELWKKTLGKHKHIIGKMNSLLLFRHWLAHGRYWVEKSGLGHVDPFTAWEIGRAIFDVLPDFAPLPQA
jgi:hypothetical protein